MSMDINCTVQEMARVTKASQELCKLYCEVMEQVVKGYSIVSDLLKKYEDIKKESSLKILTIRKAKNEYIEAHVLLEIMKIEAEHLKHEFVKEQKKLLQIEGVYEAIERVALVDREAANGWIRLLNEIKGAKENVQ